MAVITGSFNSLVSGTITGVFQNTAGGVLSGVIGTPGPAGAPGTPGAPGAPGAPGQGVPSGGSTGQALVKLDGTDYNTSWSSLPDFLTKAGNLDGLTNRATARDNLNLGDANQPTFFGVDIYGSGSNAAHLGAPFLTLIDPTYGEFVIQPSQGIVWPDASIQTTAWNDAPSDGTIYGRQDGDWVEAGGGDYLPLSGGAMDANASITASDTSTATDSELAGWGLGVQLSADHTKGTTVEFDGLDAYDGASHMQVTPTGITFPDATTQSTAGRSLTDYDFTNVSDTKLTTYGLTLAQSNPAIYSTSYLDYSYLLLNSDNTSGGTVVGSYKTSELTTSGLYNLTESFTDVDGTIVSGGLLGFNLAQTGLTFNASGTTPSSGSVQYLRSQITFGNASVQTIAFPGFNNAALTGTPTAPTAALADNDTSIATTAFVQQELASGTANARNLEVYVRNQTGSTIPIGSIVYINGATGNRPTITLAQANNDANSAQTIGFTKTAIANNGFGFVIIRGELEGLNTSALTEGVQLYLSPTTAGTWTTTKPYAPQHLVYVGIVIRSHPTLGAILVSVQNGYEVAELHDSAISGLANNDLFAYESSTDLWKNKSFATLGLAGLNSPAFTGTPSLPTGTTGITQSAGNNTTALATTAFVTTSNPDASTTVKGHVELATNAEAQNGSSDTLAMSPSTVAYAKSSPSFFRMSALSSAGATSGTGSAASLLVGGYNTRAPTTAVGYGILSFGLYFHSRASGGQVATPLPWNKRFVAQFRFAPRTLGTDANTINRVLFGKASGSTTGELTLRGVGVRQIANGALELVVHNGTTFTAVTSSFTPTVAQSSTDLRIVSDGAGNVTLFNNDTQIATTSAGPSTVGTSGNYFLTVESENLATITGTNNTLYTAEMSFEFAL